MNKASILVTTRAREEGAAALAGNRWAVLGGTVLMMLTTGALQAFSVFAPPVSATQGWALPDVMFAFGFTSLLVPVVMILSGKWLDAGYARTLMLIGGGLFGLGHIVAGLAPNLPLFVLGYGLVTGTGQGLLYSSALTNTMRYFPDRRGQVSGLITAGMGLGAVLVAPLAVSLIAKMGVSATFIALGLAFAVLNLGAALFLVRSCPAGYVPAGYTGPAKAAAKNVEGKAAQKPAAKNPAANRASAGAGARASARASARVSAKASARASAPQNLQWREMLRTARFWIIAGMFFLGGCFGAVIMSSLASIGQNMFGLAPATAALYVSLFASCNAAARIVWGSIADRWGIINTLAAVFSLGVLALAILAFGTGTWVFPVGVVIISCAFGGIMSLFAPLTVENFGPKFNGVNYGIVFIAFCLASFLAPRWGASMAATAGGDFTGALIVCMILAAVGLGLTILYRLAPQPASRGETVEAARGKAR
ncbi:OFA family MFS transporter [Actinobaculum suis]|uniref:OFA family MFS transporter n=1 Tax=Actinobaculum suis TaxID=1657 RepID=UPI000AC0CBB4|nr:OFA family MFS transporter [Actinobaculum suis]